VKIFFDSSAFAKRYVYESGSEKIEALCQQASYLGVSVICVPEVISALTRLLRESKLTSTQYKKCKQALVEDVSDAVVCLLAPITISRSIHIMESSVVRAMDALHIACALLWEAELFVTSDKKQFIAAEQAGLSAFIV